MHNNQSVLWTFLGVVLSLALLMGCGAKGQPVEFKQTAGEMKEGPGVFTGEEGALVVYDSEQGGAFPQFKGNKSEEASEKAGEAPAAASDTAAGSAQIAAGQTSGMH